MAVEMADPRLDFAHQVKRFRRTKRLLLARAYRRADFVVAVSQGVLEGMQQTYRLCKEHAAVIRNFVDLAEIDRLARQSGPEPKPGKFHVVTVGRLDEQKGQIHLLQAISHLVHRRGRREVHLNILGQGPLEQDLKSFVREQELDDFVSFLGFLSNPFAFVARCQLFCLPSIYEGLPLALLESMACRVPILATDCPSGPREVLADGRFGRLVETGSAEHLADAIQDAIDHYQDWVALVAPARDRVEREFSVDSEMARFQSLIAAVAK
jgi:glycosyltransferase involved in cell wall biosynthesis